MRVTVVAAMLLLLAAPAYAAPTELPAEMVGYWEPMRDGRLKYPDNWPGAMHRISEPAYEWEISQNGWIEWDGICKIHDVKQLGEMNYEVGATCGLIDGTSKGPPYKMDPKEAISETRYQFSLCGEILKVRLLKDQRDPKIDCRT
jgi:hypothetical protein